MDTRAILNDVAWKLALLGAANPADIGQGPTDRFGTNLWTLMEVLLDVSHHQPEPRPVDKATGIGVGDLVRSDLGSLCIVLDIPKPGGRCWHLAFVQSTELAGQFVGKDCAYFSGGSQSGWQKPGFPKPATSPDDVLFAAGVQARRRMIKARRELAAAEKDLAAIIHARSLIAPKAA